jgi:hypothetical protein
MDPVSLGKAGLQGWRARVADTVAGPVAKHSRLTDEQVRAVVGAAFLLLSVIYVAGSLRRLAGRG